MYFLILTKDMLKAHGKELLTRSKRGLMKNHTSGTTVDNKSLPYVHLCYNWKEKAYYSHVL